MRSAFGGAGGDGMSCRDGGVRGFGRGDALGGRRDAVGDQGYHLSFWLVLSRVRPPSAPCVPVGARVWPDALLPARTGPRRPGVSYSLTGLSGRAFPTLRRDAPVVAESGRRAVCRRCGRCLLSNRMLQVSSSARIATSFGPSRRRRAVPVETCR